MSREPRVYQITRVCLGAFLGVTVVANSVAGETSDEEFFESRIRPVLVAKCYECHSAESQQIGGDLLLDSRGGSRIGGESGPAIAPGQPESSLLLSAIRYEGLEMPPSGRLPDRVIADFEHWIETGAYDPRESASHAMPKKSSMDVEAGRGFWSFRSPQIHKAPNNKLASWPERKVDSFVLARLEELGMQPAEPADRRTLIRRVYFDLVGLPPSPSDVIRFIHDDRPNAYFRLVERLLASARHGERWARPWMDVARYAEDQAHIVGNNDSLFYPNAYLYRDWLVEAFNRDMPFDRFVKLQLAADLIEPSASTQLAALGFLGLGPKYYRRGAPEVMADEWEDRVDTVTRGLLGLTVACARCHDHKYDPIPTEDYYALAGVFASTEMFNRPLRAVEDKEKKEQKGAKPAESMHIVREGTPRDVPVYIRGDHTNHGDVVPRRFPQVLYEEELPLRSGSGRRQLAEAIADRRNPLTARVIVNRVWGQYFGRPLVATQSNFGNLGQRPSHPKLLDDLAVRFMQSGWSMKWLHREILHSSTYRQSTITSQQSLASDPSNKWLGRMNRRRLSIEMWRDAMLSATGEIDNAIGGKSCNVSDPKSRRRTLYGNVSRLELDAMLHMFDHPDPNVHAAKRSQTTTPLQKLFVLNSQFMVERARQLVKRLRDELPNNSTAQLRRAYELVFARRPSPAEEEMAVEFLMEDGAWPQFAQVLLASNEMMYLD